MSIINIIDTINHQITGPDAPDVMPPLTAQFIVVVMMKSGKARGRHNLRIVPEQPNGVAEKVINQPIILDGEEKGINLYINVTLSFPLEGLYWFEVFVDEELMTSIPLRINYLPQRT